VGPVGLAFSDFRAVAGFVTDMFALGLLVSLPAVTVLLVVNLVFAVVSRAAPQLNLFAIGFPVSLLAGLLVVLLTLPALTGQWEGIFGQAVQRLSALFGAR
jgi:flagellar biosynthetic protein FliR